MTKENRDMFNNTRGDSLKLLDYLAKEELDSYRRSSFKDRGEFLWIEWPYTERMLDALVAASLSHKIGRKGGLINERGQPDVSFMAAANTLRAKGLLGERETMFEFQPTELGWEMLRRFAAERATFPEDAVVPMVFSRCQVYKTKVVR